MTSDRSYRKGVPPEAAFAEIAREAGRQFDPIFAGVFVDMREAIQDEMAAQARAPLPARPTRVVSAIGRH